MDSSVTVTIPAGQESVDLYHRALSTTNCVTRGYQDYFHRLESPGQDTD